MLKTVREVMTELGGVKAVAALTGRKYSAAHRWLYYKNFPADTYTTMQAALTKTGKVADPALWRQGSGLMQEAS